MAQHRATESRITLCSGLQTYKQPVPAWRVSVASGFTAIRQCWCGIGCLMVALACAAACDAAELRGLLDLSDAVRGSTQAPLHDGLDKLPDASNRPAAHLTLRGDTELPADLVARIVADADSTRRRIGDVQEVWLGWHPIPKNGSS